MDTALVAVDLPTVRVTVKMGLHVAPRPEHRQQRCGVGQAVPIAAGIRVVMHHHEGGPVGVCIESPAEPRQLFFPQDAGGDVGAVEGIEDEPVGALPADHGGLPFACGGHVASFPG